MKALLEAYLAQNWNPDMASLVQYSPVPKEKAGDLALSFFTLTKELQKSPPVIAQEIAEALSACPLVSKTEMVGPYLNVFFASEAFFQSVLNSPTQTQSHKGKSIVLEFSGPNTNKPLHLGHVRNHALGISTSNLLEAVGANVHRVNIINDRGVHICKSMLAYKHFGEGKTPDSEGKKSDHFVGDFYVKYDIESKKNPELASEVQQMLVDWENGDFDTRSLWKKMNDWTLKGHQATYERQGLVFEKSYYESEVYLEGKAIAEQGVQKGAFYKRDDGAIEVDLEAEGLDKKVVLRADGTSIYLTQDLAVAKLRYEDFKPDLMMYTVADEQNYHFKVLFHCIDKLGILPVEALYHLSYGLVNLPDGRMKSREGNVVDADNLMDELSELALIEIQKRNPELSPEIANTLAEQIMNGAWKFYILSTSPKKTITFDAQKSIDFQGATGPYIQYAGVRIRSLFEKSGYTMENLPPIDFQAFTEEEKPLGVKILEYPDMLEKAAQNYNTTYVVTYLIELAQEWSRYYANTSLLNADTVSEKEARLALAAKVYKTLEAGLGILGIEIPAKM